MVLKRKRSDSEISTSSSLFSSPLNGTNFMMVENLQHTIPTPALFHSRTRKRYRDNRPSESQVHQHTLSMLFGAQQAQSPSSTLPSQFPIQTPVSTLPSHPSTQQSSLHAFWALPSKPRSGSSPTSSTISTPSTSPPRDTFSTTHCEDCNICLNPADDGDNMDVDMMAMDVDDGNYGCTSCGKQVCHGCAVSNLGADRKCLTCAKPKSTWHGGLRWVPN